MAKHASEMTSICTVFVLCFRTYDNIFFGNGNSGVFRLSVVFWPGSRVTAPPGGGALGYFLFGYVPPGTPNWHPVLEKISPKIDTPF